MPLKKNVVLFIGDDVVAHMFLNHFIPQMVAKDINPILVRVSGKKPSAYNNTELNRYHFYENELLNDIVAPHLNGLADRPMLTTLTQDQLIAKYNLKTIETSNVNSQELSADLNGLDFIGAISIRCFQIFKTNIIRTIQSKGFFCNSHPGILPYHKGVFCMLRGIVNGQSHLGWTMHEIDEGIDTGRIIKRLPIQNNTIKNPIPLYEQSIKGLSDAWVQYINDHIDHGYVDSYQQSLTGEYYTYPTQSELDKWMANGQLDKIDTRAMVSFYYNLFIPQTARFAPYAMDFKILLINRISQFEMMMEQNDTMIPYSTKSQKIAA